MALEYSVEMTSHKDEVISAKNEAIERILETWGEIGEGSAINIITEEGRVDTDLLRGSITHEVDMGESAVEIGTNVEYAIYNEIGTGIYAEGGGGRQTPWRYQDRQGNWHVTKGMKGIHFLKRACEENLDTFQSIAEAELKDGE